MSLSVEVPKRFHTACYVCSIYLLFGHKPCCRVLNPLVLSSGMNIAQYMLTRVSGSAMILGLVLALFLVLPGFACYFGQVCYLQFHLSWLYLVMWKDKLSLIKSFLDVIRHQILCYFVRHLHTSTYFITKNELMQFTASDEVFLVVLWQASLTKENYKSVTLLQSCVGNIIVSRTIHVW